METHTNNAQVTPMDTAPVEKTPEAPAMTGMPFAEMQLVEPLQKALKVKNYTHASPIQEQAIPHLLEGKDLLGSAQTGTGKTAAFALPILQRLAAAGSRRATPCAPRALILSPTRELAHQIADSFVAYGKFMKLRLTCVYGGVSQYGQVRDMQRGVDILIATPGRLLDLEDQGYIKLNEIEIFVLDEADRMLDMGFVNDIKRIVAELPQKRQSLFFSATLSREIVELSKSMLTDPVHVTITPQFTTAEKIDQRVCFIQKADKLALLTELMKNNAQGLTLVFNQTKHGANRLSETLAKAGFRSTAIHGNKTQAARKNALDGFRSGFYKTLVATDVAARGIDVKGITLVVNFDMPDEPESYVHRIGRTARAGAEGLAISFCTNEDVESLHGIQRLIKKTIPTFNEHPWHSSDVEQGATRPIQRGQGGGNSGGGYRRRQGGGGRGGRPSFRGGASRGGYSRDGGGENRGEGFSQAGGERRSGPKRSTPQSGGFRSAGGGQRRPSFR